MSDERRSGDGADERRGERLAAEIPRLALPEERAEAIRDALRVELATRAREQAPTAEPAPTGESSPGTPTPSRALRLIAASLLLALVAWWVVGGSRVRLLPAEGGAGPFETLAISTHEVLRQEGAELDLVSEKPAEVREWLSRAGLSADLVSERPEIDAGRFELLGASRIATTFPAAAVSYRIDGRPVTLAVTAAEHAPEVPNWSPIGKNVRFSSDGAARMHVLTWRNAGKAYTLVTELPSRGLDSCLICHTDSKRRRLVERLQSES